MPRVKSNVARLKRKNKVMKLAKGYWGGRRGSNFLRMLQNELLFEVFGSDFIERTGGHTRRGNAQSFGLGEHFFVLQAKLF